MKPERNFGMTQDTTTPADADGVQWINALDRSAVNLLVGFVDRLKSVVASDFATPWLNGDAAPGAMPMFGFKRPKAVAAQQQLAQRESVLLTTSFGAMSLTAAFAAARQARTCFRCSSCAAMPPSSLCGGLTAPKLKRL